MTAADIELAKQYAQTLAGLIDNEPHDELGELLQPIYDFLVRLGEYPAGPGQYKLSVYYLGDDELEHHVGIWEGTATDRSHADAQATDQLGDDRIAGWRCRLLEFTPEGAAPGDQGEYLLDSPQECQEAKLHLMRCDDSGYCEYCGGQ